MIIPFPSGKLELLLPIIICGCVCLNMYIHLAVGSYRSVFVVERRKKQSCFFTAHVASLLNPESTIFVMEIDCCVNR